MPTPARTSLDDIVAAGRDLLESGGPDAITMQAVAQRVGVRAPSLYKRVADRDALIALVADAVVADLHERLARTTDVRTLAHALRAWAHTTPEAFRLAFSGRASASGLAEASAPILAVGASIAGEEKALEAARLLTAWATGFISMELAGAFQLGGDVDEAFEYALDHLTGSFAQRAS